MSAYLIVWRILELCLACQLPAKVTKLSDSQWTWMEATCSPAHKHCRTCYLVFVIPMHMGMQWQWHFSDIFHWWHHTEHHFLSLFDALFCLEHMSVHGCFFFFLPIFITVLFFSPWGLNALRISCRLCFMQSLLHFLKNSFS